MENNMNETEVIETEVVETTETNKRTLDASTLKNTAVIGFVVGSASMAGALIVEQIPDWVENVKNFFRQRKAVRKMKKAMEEESSEETK